jgi:hypothetical protein
MRIKHPKNLDKFAASPIGDPHEFESAFAAITQLYPNLELGYVGTDGQYHYFQRWGDPVAYAVRVTHGWSPSGYQTGKPS